MRCGPLVVLEGATIECTRDGDGLFSPAYGLSKAVLGELVIEATVKGAVDQ